MNIYERIGDNLNRIASATSRRRVKREEGVRLSHHGGPAHVLRERALPFADETEKTALRIEADL